MTDAERTAFLFNLTTGVKLDERLTRNRCSTDAPTDPDCGSYQTANNPNWGPSFGGPAGSGQDLSLGCSIDVPECNGDLRFGTAFAQSYGGKPRSGAFWMPGAQHPAIFASSWWENDWTNWVDFARCKASCGAFVVEALEVFSVTPLAGTRDSNVATVTIHVTGNTPPNAVDDLATVRAGDSVDIAIVSNDSDAESDPVTVILTQPAHGTVEDRGDGTITYTPAGALGLDSFTYTIDDGFGGQDTATVTVDVTPTRILTVKADNQSKTYNGVLYSGFTASYLSDTPCTLLTPPTFGGTAAAAIDRGSYTITVSGVRSSDCTVMFAQGSLDIAPAPLTVTPRDASRRMGSGPGAGRLRRASRQRRAHHHRDIRISRRGGHRARRHLFDHRDGDQRRRHGRLANYTPSLQTATLTVNRKTLTVTPTSQAKVYGTAASLGGVIWAR